MKKKLLLLTLGCMLTLAACGGTTRPDNGTDKPAVSEDTETGSADEKQAPAEEQPDTEESEEPSEETESTETEIASDNPGSAEPNSLQSTGFDTPAMKKLQDRLTGHDSLAGIAYMEYFMASENTEEAIREALSWSNLTYTHPFISKIDEEHTVLAGGEELYCLVPSLSVSSVTVFEYDPLTDPDAVGEVLYESDSPAPILINCNVSDIAGNTLVRLTTVDGQTLDYSPSLSLKDGSIKLEKGIVDFSLARNLLTLPHNEPLEINGDELLLSMEADEYEGGPVSLSYKGTTLAISDYTEWLQKSYVLKTGENSFYAMIVLGFSNDWNQTVLVKYDPANGLILCNEIEGRPTDLAYLTAEDITIASRADCFGTYSTYCSYAIMDDTLVKNDNYCDFRNAADPTFAQYYSEAENDNDYIRYCYDKDGCRVLTVIKDFASSPIDGNPVTIPAGAVIRPLGYDPTVHLFYFDYDDERLSVEYNFNQDGYTFSIDGVAQDEIFAVLPYAG